MAAEEVSAASGALFRIGFGIVGVVLVVRFFARGWIETLLIEPAYHFSYPGFEWVRVWPEPWMHLHFLVIGLSALGIAIGYRYRLSAGLFAVSLGYVELIDRSLYLNHYYWVVLTAAVMVFLPLSATLSLDAATGPRPHTEPVSGMGDLDAPLPGRDGLCLRRTGQAQRRLAVARRAAVDLAAGPI